MTQVEIAEDARGFAHPALFYQGPWEYRAGTVPFILEGLAANVPVTVAAPGPRLRLLRDALGAHAKRVQLLDMTVAGRNPGRIMRDGREPRAALDHVDPFYRSALRPAPNEPAPPGPHATQRNRRHPAVEEVDGVARTG